MKQIFTFIHMIAFLLVIQQSNAQEIQAGAVCSEAIQINCGDVNYGSTANVANDNVTSGALQCVTSVGTGGQVWYSFTDTDTHLISAYTCGAGTSFDTKISVYTGACGSLTCVTGNDDGCSGFASTVSFTSQPGQTYLIRVGGFATMFGSFQFTLACDEYSGGCTDVTSANYDASATFDDGSCLYEGCTDPSAMNYDQFANFDNGSCEYCDGEGSVLAQMYVCTFANGAQVALEIVDSNGNVVEQVENLANNQIFYLDVCLQAGQCYTVNMSNALGLQGWSNGYFWINSNGIQVINQSLNVDATTESTFFSVDGTCTAISGCTDPLAGNYNATANVDDGSCVYPAICETGTSVTVSISTGTFPSECSFSILDANGLVIYTGGGYYQTGTFYDSFCAEDGCYTVILNDSFGDGWNGGWLMLSANSISTTYTVSTGNTGVGALAINVENCQPTVTSGCMNPSADNYNPSAVYDDGSCLYSGCTDPAAINYNPSANVDDNSCTYCNGEGSVTAQIYICTFSNGQQVELQIVDGFGNVVYEANNLGNSAIINASLCLQPGVCYTAIMSNNTGPFGWYNGYFWINANGIQIINAQPDATDQTASVQFSVDGTCGPIPGCTDATATNYNPEATLNDGSCIYPSYGCMDPLAINYNFYATADDGSCVYAEDCTANLVVFQLTPGVFTNEASFDVVDANGAVIATGTGAYTGYACIPDGCYSINMYDSFGDGWDGGGYLDVIVNGVAVGQFTLVQGLNYGFASFGVNAEGCTPVVAGCMDPTALNYNVYATEDDGSCIYPENCDYNLIAIMISTQTWGSEMSWNLIGADGAIVASGGNYTSWNYYTEYVCLPDGCYELQMNDSWGDGWNGGYYSISGANAYYEGSLFYGSTTTDLIGINSDCGQIAGCTDSAALNYNPSATYDDGSCIFNDFVPGTSNFPGVGLELEFNMYPNPTNGGIILDLNNLDARENISLNISSLDGKLVNAQFIANSDSFRRIQMDMSDLASGYYFVRVVNGTNVQTMPLIKQ